MALTKVACGCANPDCEFGGRWIVGGMRLLKNGKVSCVDLIYKAASPPPNNLRSRSIWSANSFRP